MSWLDSLPYYTKCKGAYWIFAIIIGIIFIYAIGLRLIYGNNGRITGDFMNRNFIDITGNHPISYWGLSHFLLFMFLGILFPDCDLMIITAGILWELFEVFMSIVTRSAHQTVITNNNVEYKYQWWGGSIKDIFLNIAGFYVGKAYRRSWEHFGGTFPYQCCQTPLPASTPIIPPSP